MVWGSGSTYQRELRRKEEKVKMVLGDASFYRWPPGPCVHGISWELGWGRFFVPSCLAAVTERKAGATWAGSKRAGAGAVYGKAPGTRHWHGKARHGRFRQRA
jgi:hypothetical protein